MVTESVILNRKSIRLKGYDYRQPGAYFITLVCWHHKCIIGKVTNGNMQLNSIGKILQSEWQNLPYHFPNIRMEAFTILPNHLHGIIVIEDFGVGATHPPMLENYATNDGSPLQKYQKPGPSPSSIGAMIGQYKSRATKLIQKLNQINHPIWQRNYYEHIIRNDLEFHRIIQYIETNPSQWSDDKYYFNP